MNEKHVALAAKLYGARQVLKDLWGDEYAAKIEAPMKVLQMLADAQSSSVTETAVNEAKHSANNYQVEHALVMLAAAVEILDAREER